jgi:hypothetical protein
MIDFKNQKGDSTLNFKYSKTQFTSEPFNQTKQDQWYFETIGLKSPIEMSDTILVAMFDAGNST